MRLKHVLLFAAVGAVPLSAHAQAVTPAPLDTTFFFPAPSPGSVFALDTSQVTAPQTLSGGVLLDFALRSLVARTGDQALFVVNNLTQLHLFGAYGIGQKFEVSALLPVTVFSALDLGDGPQAQFAKLGDAKLRLKSGILPAPEKGLGIAITAEFSAPTGRLTGSDEVFLGSAGVEFTPGAALEYRMGKTSLVANVGYTLREQTALGTIIIDDRISTGLGATIGLSPTLTALVEAEAELPSDLGAGSGANETPAEFRLGARYTKDSLRLSGGIGAGFPLGDATGIGSPLFRLFLSGSFARPADNDADNDGFTDELDKCKQEPEDADKFDDADGCPDPDNDQDNIPDELDACGLEPEDMDGFNDTDGCPELDNDFDGVPDETDKCRDQAEDGDSFQDEDGCPEDNDGDGIPDEADKCRDQAEDKDAFQDEDGCPDPDNDQDGVLDAADKCQGEQETKNEYQDDDGCADTKPLAQVEGKRIVIYDQVKFATGKATIDAASFALLDTVGKILLDNPSIGLIRIEGHTDNVGKPAGNLKLSDSRAKAVAAYLTKTAKVDAKRLFAKGYGQTCALVENTDEASRAQNRRVEFVILDEGEDPKGTCRAQKK
jgi:outer membrane protein OmpA-like peptidoglycan-associated protein